MSDATFVSLCAAIDDTALAGSIRKLINEANDGK